MLTTSYAQKKIIPLIIFILRKFSELFLVHKSHIRYICCLVNLVMDWIVSPPTSNLYVETLAPNLTIFGEKAFNKVFKMKSGHKSRTLTPQDLHPCKKRKRHKASFSHYGSTEERPWEDKGQRWLSTSQEERSHKKPNPLASWSCSSSLHNCEKNKFLLFMPVSV